MSILSLLFDHWPWVVVVLAIGLGTAYVHERDERIRAEAVSAERLEDFRAVDSARAVAEAALTRRESEHRADSIRLTRLEREADSLRAASEAGVREASSRAVEAGEDVRATLDSLIIAETMEDARRLAHVAQTQLTEHLRADRETMAEVEGERGAAASLVRSLRGQVASERGLRLETVGVLEDTEAALDEARSALDARAQSEQGWVEQLWAGLRVVGAFGAGYGAAKVF